MTSQEGQNSVNTQPDANQPQQTEPLVANNEQSATAATSSTDAGQNGNPPLVRKARVARKLTQAERDAKNLNVSWSVSSTRTLFISN